MLFVKAVNGGDALSLEPVSNKKKQQTLIKILCGCRSGSKHSEIVISAKELIKKCKEIEKELQKKRRGEKGRNGYSRPS